ncbi:hypothetical protein EJ06DRAFT_525697 [Trichodelitschia bisporula]|uniref:Uncharacterized protein n=1 Tax=Trichodelitschia bisporula TaxID=703511 RepID=A0A6G1IA38_9PEZI|nr:hypothetical protein EJ06DRAFT_525697 [Trichodelitschia bisporula]
MSAHHPPEEMICPDLRSRILTAICAISFVPVNTRRLVPTYHSRGTWMRRLCTGNRSAGTSEQGGTVVHLR